MLDFMDETTIGQTIVDGYGRSDGAQHADVRRSAGHWLAFKNSEKGGLGDINFSHGFHFSLALLLLL